ncbi:hypothetical protein LTR08_000505 [Meristemomyces frigidus]|nr:hypothetical protein LTR08_000505 [Meristemomyces frigidus]
MMASHYAAFLASPRAALLAPDASLSYITTTTEFNAPAAIITHLQAQTKQVEKKQETVLSAVESSDGVALEIETTLLFKNGGGAFLPGMDANLLDEMTVTFPMVHFVRFDAQHKIRQVRLHWDQGTVLKQVEAIGKTGRNWPIKDGKPQVDAVKKSVKAGGQTQATNGKASAASGARGANDVVISQHKKSDSITATRDPHASLSLFAERDPNEEAESHSYHGPSHATRASAKPLPRDFADIAGEDRSASPTRGEGRAGAGKHHQNNRLFDENEPPASARSPERKKTYGGKYDHFTFGDGEETPEKARPSSSRSGGNKNQTRFAFGESATPPKNADKPRPDYERHWGADVEEDAPPSPAKRPIVHAARPDADAHFQLTDNASPAAASSKPPSFQRQKGLDLYQDTVHDNARAEHHRQPNINHSRRGDDIGAPYDMMTEASGEDRQVGQGRTSKARTLNESSWDFGEQGPERSVYKTAGDGMGGRKGQGHRGWGIGSESGSEGEGAGQAVRKRKDGRGGRLAQAEAGSEYPDY